MDNINEEECTDLKTLQPSKYILGQVLDALFIVISNNLFSYGIKTFILPESFFTRIHQDISLESVIPNDCHDIDLIVAASFFNSHWSLVMLDVCKKYILYLDPIVSGFVSKDKMSADLSVIKNIVWYSVMENPLDSEVPNILPGWQIIDHESFLSVYNTNLPHQEYGNDCGIFIVMYFWHLSHGSVFG